MPSDKSLEIENILTEQVFARSFLNLVIGKENGLPELNELDPEIYKNLMALKYTKVLDLINSF